MALLEPEQIATGFLGPTTLSETDRYQTVWT